MNYNKTILAGRMARDVEMRYTPSGTAIAVFGVAYERTYLKDGEKQKEVSFFDVTAFGKTAETISQYFSKGDPIFIEARLKQDTWSDKQTGQKRSKVNLILEQFQFVGTKRDRSEEPRTKPNEPPKREVEYTADDMEFPEPGDVPF